MKNKTYFLFVLLFFFAKTANAQVIPDIIKPPQTPKSTRYKPKRRRRHELTIVKIDSAKVLPPEKIFFLHDDFSDNRNSWQVYSNEHGSATIINGTLLLKSSENYYFEPLVSVAGFDEKSNYFISATIRFVNGALNQGNGLVFGAGSEGGFRFLINSTGSYAVYESLQNGSDVPLIEWTSDPSLRIGYNLYNKLAVKKIGSRWYFYINDVLINSVPYRRIFGQKFGFYNRSSVIACQNFEVKKLDNYDQSPLSSTLNYKDDFFNSYSGWTQAFDDTKQISYFYGKFRFKGKSKNFDYYSSKNFNVDLTKNFELKVTARWIGGHESNVGYGLYYCGDIKLGSYYIFVISNKGYYKVLHFIGNGRWEDLIAWTKSDFIMKNLPNILSIKKEDNIISYFINDHKVAYLTSTLSTGHYFGMIVQQAQTVDFENFIINGDYEIK